MVPPHPTPFAVLLVVLVGVLLVQPSDGLPPTALRDHLLLRRLRRQTGGGGYDEKRQDVGFGQGYGYGGYDEYCQDCAHCNGCGHAPNRRVLSEYDYVPTSKGYK